MSGRTADVDSTGATEDPVPEDEQALVAMEGPCDGPSHLDDALDPIEWCRTTLAPR